MKIKEIIQKLEAFHPALEHPFTCDVVKIGDADAECSGIILTCFASMEVIRQAIQEKANLIICHEPLFYSHEDTTDWLAGDPVYEEKRKLLEENGIVVYRDHDHIHGGHGGQNIDGIFYGIMNELGWKEYVVGDTKKPLLYEIPQTTVPELADFLMEKLNISGIRVVGSRDTQVRRVFFCEHVQGARPFGNRTEIPDNETMKRVRREQVDVLIPFEIIDWTLSAYVRDSCAAGMPKTILEMGHFNVEELGMRYMLQYLPQVIGDSVPMKYVQSGDSFSYITKA
ncbi:MAG: Nif3-like dinuclear metal center hexameric protein [Lachnospiraceae bacterium]|nr:Nif3-like dinuclear metal center hexameric protein [Lachnospiraceae bacterium]